MFMLLAALLVIAAAAVALAVAWSWRNDALRPSEQERFDLEFERIVRRLDSSSL